MITLLLLVAYAIYIQHERGGLWNICRLAAIVGYPLDVLANYTELALLTWDFPPALGNGHSAPGFYA